MKVTQMNRVDVHPVVVGESSVTRFGDFWNFLAINFITKVAQIFGDFLGFFEKHPIIT